MKAPRILLDEIIISDEPGFACSKSKLVENGLIHLRPFNITNDGELSLDQIYRVPPEEAPNGKKILEEGDILFNNTNSVELVGKAALVERPIEAGFSNHLTRLRFDRTKIVPHYAAYWLRRKRDTGFFSAHATRWVSQAAFKSSELRRLKMSLPTLEEQHQIVDIFSRAEGIVRLRREAQKKAGELIPALFLEMFGDPATNPKGWRMAKLDEFITFITSGSRGWARYYALEGGRFIRSIDVRMNEISDESAVFVNAPKGAEAERTRVKSGDVLLTITGSQIGRVAPVPEKVAGAFISQHVAIIRLKLGLLPIFLSLFLSMENGGQREIARLQYGQTKPGLNLSQIREFMVPIPPISVQQKFEAQIEQVRSVQYQQSVATKQAEATFEALLSRIFRCQCGAGASGRAGD